MTDLAPNTSYTLTVWAKASDATGKVKVYLKNYGGVDQVQTVTRRLTRS